MGHRVSENWLQICSGDATAHVNPMWNAVHEFLDVFQDEVLHFTVRDSHTVLDPGGEEILGTETLHAVACHGGRKAWREVWTGAVLLLKQWLERKGGVCGGGWVGGGRM